MNPFVSLARIDHVEGEGTGCKLGICTNSFTDPQSPQYFETCRGADDLLLLESFCDYSKCGFWGGD